MNCPKCQAQLPDDARFCGKCGANIAQTEENATASNETQTGFVPPQPPVYTQPQQSYTQPQQSYSAPAQNQQVSIVGWVCRWLINLIPCVGPIIYIIMLFVWAFDTKYNETSRNWAKAQLIISLISAVLGVIIVCIVTAMGVNTVHSIRDYMY